MGHKLDREIDDLQQELFTVRTKLKLCYERMSVNYYQTDEVREKLDIVKDSANKYKSYSQQKLLDKWNVQTAAWLFFYQELHALLQKKINQLLQQERDTKERLQQLLTERENRKNGYWRNLLGWHIGLPAAALAGLTAGIMIFEAVMELVGIGLVVPWISGIVAGFFGFTFFAQDGSALRSTLTEWGEEIDATSAWDFIKNHKLAIFKWLLIIASMLTCVGLVLFPPAFMVTGLGILGLSGLSGFALTMVAGSMAFLATYPVTSIVEHIAKKLFSQKSDNDKKQNDAGFWEQFLSEKCGMPMAVVASIASGALAFTFLIIFYGTGGIAGAVAGGLAFITGLVFFAQDGSSLRQRLREWGRDVDQVGSWGAYIYENKLTIAWTLFTAAAVIASAIIIAFPPAAIAAPVASIISLVAHAAVPVPAAMICSGLAAFIVCRIPVLLVFTYKHIKQWFSNEKQPEQPIVEIPGDVAEEWLDDELTETVAPEKAIPVLNKQQLIDAGEHDLLQASYRGPFYQQGSEQAHCTSGRDYLRPQQQAFVQQQAPSAHPQTVVNAHQASNTYYSR